LIPAPEILPSGSMTACSATRPFPTESSGGSALRAVGSMRQASEPRTRARYVFSAQPN
jgi:hypothetical protein